MKPLFLFAFKSHKGLPLSKTAFIGDLMFKAFIVLFVNFLPIISENPSKIHHK